MDLPKNILNSSQFQKPLPLGPQRQLPQRSLLTKHSEEEIVQSYKMKKNMLIQALQSKKLVTQFHLMHFQGNLKDYYSIINRQGFVNAKEEPQALRIWVKVFLETITNIIHEYQDHELVELLVFKLPWFTPTTTHGQNFNCFMRLCLAVFPHDVSYIHKVIKHIFSPHGLFQCIMLGEHRPALADLLWDRGQVIIKSMQEAGSAAEEEEKKTTIFSEDQLLQIHKALREMKTPEDILARAKCILRRHSDPNQSAIIKIQDLSDQIFLKILFSFHPTRDLPEDPYYPILIGKCYGYPTYFVQSFKLTDQVFPDEDDAISIKKCLNNIVQEQTLMLKNFSEKKFQNSNLKKLGVFLSKIMNLYPFSYQYIVQSLTEKLPHKSMPVENQYLYYKMVLEIAKACPETEEKILESIVEKLCQLDVDIKTKIRKFQFSSMSKIQPMNSYLKELSVQIPNEKETKMGLLFDLILEYILERVKQMSLNLQQKVNSFDDFIEILMKIFETKIFPIHKMNFMQYLPLFIMTLSTQHEACKIFSEKFISFLIYKAFNEGSKEHLSIRQQAWNYLSSLLSRENRIVSESTYMKALQFILNRFNMIFKTKKSNALMRSPSNLSQASSTDASEPIQIREDFQASQDRIFLHCFIQGLALIITNKNDAIVKYDADLFKKLCKIVFKKHHYSLNFCSPLILSDLLKLIDTNKHGLGIFKAKLRNLFKRQQEELKNSKRQIYNKVSKFMAYEVPIHVYPVHLKFVDSLTYEDFNSPVSQTPEKTDQVGYESAALQSSEEQLKYSIKNEEIDFPSSTEEEKKRCAISQENQSDNSPAVLYVPDIGQFAQKEQDDNDVDMPFTSEKDTQLKSKPINLESAIAKSRNCEKTMGLNVHFADPTFNIGSHQRVPINPFSKLNQNTLSALNGGLDSSVVQSEDFEGISSSRDTEYSVSPQILQKKVHFATNAEIAPVSDKSKRNRSIERTKKNITMNLKEENDRADLQLVLKKAN